MSKKTSVPMSAGSVLPKLLWALVALGLLVLVVKHPADAATWAKSVATWLGSVVDGVAAFFRGLAG